MDDVLSLRYFVQHLGVTDVPGPLHWCGECLMFMPSPAGHVLVCPWWPREMEVRVVPLRYLKKIDVSIGFANPVASDG